jgi:phosphatidylglycerol---prolipoprotein diacylglyceryl transferase
MLALLGTITINIDPVLVKVGPFSLRWYGLMYVLGIVLGLVIMFPYARRLGIKDEAVWNVFWGTAIAALIGGRLYYIVQNDPGSYVHNPGDLFAFWQGGMAFFGAIFLGLPVLLLLSRQQRIPLGYALDCVAIFAPLAQAVGRIGNIINGDVIGYPSNLPWATAYTNPHSFVPVNELNQAVQPAGAYELLFSLGLFLVLWPLRFRLRPAGMLFVLYLSLYCVGQFVIFIWRDNPIVTLNLKQAQVTAIFVEAALVLFAYLIVLRPAWFDPDYAMAPAGYDDDYPDEEDEDLGTEGADAGVAAAGSTESHATAPAPLPSASEHVGPTS